MKKFLSLLLIFAMLFTLTACGESDERSNSDKGGKGPAADSGDGYTFYGNDDPTTVGTVSNPLDPQEIYRNLTYIPEMFYGTYSLHGDWQLTDSQGKAFLEAVGTMEIADGATHMDGAVISTIPYRIQAGPDTLDHALSFITSKNWARLTFYKESGSLTECMAAYEINGTTISFNPALAWKYDKETNFISYQMSEIVWTYDFAFSGPHLSLSQSGKQASLVAEKYVDPDYRFQFEGYREVDSPTFDGMDLIHCHSGKTIILDAEDSSLYHGEAMSVTEDGLVTMSWLDRDNNKYTRQFVYFLCGFDGIVLVDRENTYRFTAEYYERSTAGLKDMVSFEEQKMLENLSEDKTAEILEKKANLLVDLAAAYADSGLNVTIDEATGEITLDSSVLFDVNSSTVSEDGKAFLEQFINIYSSVVFDSKYDGFLSQIMVEGHTDTNGDYDMNLQLSQARAESVRDYCLSVSADHVDALTTMLSPVGYSYTDPVYGADGKVDMAASRRVAFRFLINLAG